MTGADGPLRPSRDHGEPGDEGEPGEVPLEVVERVRSICLALPEAHEEPAWTGTRWRIRTRTFAHVLLIDRGWPPAYSRAAATAGPALVLMFRRALPDADALRSAGPPWFAVPWRADEVGLQVDAATHWPTVATLLTDSYRLLAPRKLASSVPPATSDPTPP